MRFLALALVISGLALLSGCGETTTPVVEEPGSVGLSVSLAPLRDLGISIGLVAVYSEHLAHGYRDTTALDILPDSLSAEGTVDELAHGPWDVYVALYDSQFMLVASGRDTVEILPGRTVQADIMLQFERGGMDVNVTWGATIHLAIDGQEVASLPAYTLPLGTAIQLNGSGGEITCSCLFDNVELLTSDSTVVFDDDFSSGLDKWVLSGDTPPSIDFSCFEDSVLQMHYSSVGECGACSAPLFDWPRGWTLSMDVYVWGYLGRGGDGGEGVSAAPRDDQQYDYWNSVRFGVASESGCGGTYVPTILVQLGDNEPDLIFSTDGGTNSVALPAGPYYNAWHTFTLWAD